MPRRPELVPPVWKQSARVWESLIEHAAIPSLVAHLRAMGEAGVFRDPSLTAMLVARLSNRAKLAALGHGALESALAEYRMASHGHTLIDQVLLSALSTAANPVAVEDRRRVA